MPEKKLAAVLNELHMDLVAAENVDAETRLQLETLMGDIQRILAQADKRNSESVDPVQTDLNSILLKLESNHPTTAGLLHRVADALANLGI